MNDIVEELLIAAAIEQDCGGVTRIVTFDLELRAADEITRLREEVSNLKNANDFLSYAADDATSDLKALREENEKLGEALEVFADCAEELDGSEDLTRFQDYDGVKFQLLASDYRKARAALKDDTE